MSRSSPHAYTAAFVLLLAAFSHVHSLHKKASNDQQQNRLDSVEQHWEHVEYYENSNKLQHHDQWPRYKEKVHEKLLDYTDEGVASKFTKTVSDKVSNFASVKDKYVNSKESHSQSNTKNKSGKDDSQQHITDSFKLHDDNTTDVTIYNQTSSVDSEHANSLDLELRDEFLPQLEEDANSSWSNNSSLHNSSSESRNSDAESSQNSGCRTCRMRTMDKNYRILSFKQQILNTLQIRNLPNTTGVPIPKFPALTHLYEMNGDMMSDSPYGRKHSNGNHYHDTVYDDDFIVKTERVFTAAKPAPIGLHFNLTDTVYFPPSVQLFSSKIKTAHLWFYIRKGEVAPTIVTVDRILPETLSERKVITKTVFSQKLSKEKAFGWKRIDMRNTLRQWIRHPMTNFGLQMRAEDKSRNNLIVLPPAQDTDKGYEPWLDTQIIEPRSNSRRRRSESLMCVENSTDTRCCRHPLLVGFAEFGWDWIIAPTHVKADYCTGECRMTMQDNTPHSWVNQQTPGSNTCCTPTKLSPLPLLYFDESMDIVYQILQNMKVDKCGCA